MNRRAAKILISVLMAVALAGCLCGCGGGDNEPEETVVITTVSPQEESKAEAEQEKELKQEEQKQRNQPESYEKIYNRFSKKMENADSREQLDEIFKNGKKRMTAAMLESKKDDEEEFTEWFKKLNEAYTARALELTN